MTSLTGSPTRCARPTARPTSQACGPRCSGLSECSSMVFAVLRASCLTITSPSLVLTTTRSPRRVGAAGDTTITSPLRIGRLHRVAGNLQRIGVLVVDRGESDFVPALADRKAAVVEIAARAGFGEADQRHRLGDRARGLGNQRDEGLDAGAGRGQRFRDRLGRGPAGAAVRRDALRLVEGGGIEPGLLGEAGRGEPGARREPVDGSPDLSMRQHGESPCAAVRSTGCEIIVLPQVGISARLRGAVQPCSQRFLCGRAAAL